MMFLLMEIDIKERSLGIEMSQEVLQVPPAYLRLFLQVPVVDQDLLLIFLHADCLHGPYESADKVAHPDQLSFKKFVFFLQL